MTAPDDARHLELTLADKGGTITVGGHDLSHAVRAITLWARAGSPPNIELDLALDSVHLLGDQDTRVGIPERTRAALIALGWTPPATTPATPTAQASTGEPQ